MESQLGWAAIQMLAGLAGVVVLLVGAMVAVRRLGLVGRGRRGGQLEMVDSLFLGPRKQVAVVRFLDELLVLGVSESGICVLTRRTVEDNAHEAFATALRAADRSSCPAGSEPCSGR